MDRHALDTAGITSIVTRTSHMTNGRSDGMFPQSAEITNYVKTAWERPKLKQKAPRRTWPVRAFLSRSNLFQPLLREKGWEWWDSNPACATCRRYGGSVGSQNTALSFSQRSFRYSKNSDVSFHSIYAVTVYSYTHLSFCFTHYLR